MSNRVHILRRRSVTARRVAGLAGAGLVLLPLAATPAFAAAGFTPGGLVVYRVGNGSATLSSVATPDFLDEYSVAGTLETTVALPTFSSGSATSEGELTLSGDGTHLLATGYVTTSGTAGIASTTAAAAPRAVDVVDSSGTVDDVTQFTGQFSGNNIRSAASPDGTSIVYAGGATTPGGVAEAPVTNGAATPTQITSSSGNIRGVEDIGGQLYYSSGSSTGPIGVSSVGTGLPTTAGQTTTALPGLDSGSSGSPYAFVLFDEGSSTPNVAYVADSSAGLQKYVLTSGTWTLDGTVTETGLTGLTGTYANGVATLYATDPTTLFSVVDTTGTGTLSATPTVVATAGTNEAFRGVAFAPVAASAPASTPESPLTVALPAAFALLAGGAFALNRRRSRA